MPTSLANSVAEMVEPIWKAKACTSFTSFINGSSKFEGGTSSNKDLRKTLSQYVCPTKNP